MPENNTQNGGRNAVDTGFSGSFSFESKESPKTIERQTSKKNTVDTGSTGMFSFGDSNSSNTRAPRSASVSNIERQPQTVGLDKPVKSISRTIRPANNQQFLEDRAYSYEWYGIPKELSKVFVAQDIHESGWGQHVSNTNNYGGMKSAIKDATTAVETWEHVQQPDGSWKKVKTFANFQAFDTPEDYTAAKLNWFVQRGMDLTDPTLTADTLIDQMIKFGYATDREYKKKLKDVMNSIKNDSVFRRTGSIIEKENPLEPRQYLHPYVEKVLSNHQDATELKKSIGIATD